jgi:hypothetical protein
MTANLQRALRLLEDGYPRVRSAGGGSPPGTGLWSFCGDDDGGGDGSGGDSGGGGGGGADGLLRVSGTGPTEAERASERARRATGVAAACGVRRVARRGRDAAAARALIQYMALKTLIFRCRLAQRTTDPGS